jgi:hypothetical protein
MIRKTALAVALAAAIGPAAAALAASAHTVAAPAAQRAGMLKAFGDPAKAASCLSTRLAASNHSYGTVRPSHATRCTKWAFDGVNVLHRTSGTHWKVKFEGSSYACPVKGIPTRVQRDLGVCPQS